MPLSVYVHVPFCRSRCRYCAFYSGEPGSHLPGYPAWLAAEAPLRARCEPGVCGPVSTVYFGGGTPSLLGPSGVARVLEAVDRAWGIDAGAEITLEENPGGATDFRGFRAAGVTRLSVGVQSLDDGILRWLGRPHTGAQALDAVSKAAEAGVPSVSADLLFGLPRLDRPLLRKAVRALRKAGAQHVSTYSLEVHPGTPLEEDRRSGDFVPPSAQEEEAQWSALDEELEECGYRAYEVSNYAAPGHRCRHNLAYWTGQAYVGLGPGAHGFDPRRGPWGTRSWNDPGLAAYASRVRTGALPAGGAEALSAEESLLEALFLALRRPETVDVADLCRRHGADEDGLLPRLREAIRSGLLRPDPSGAAGLIPTRKGLRAADGLALWLHRAVVP